MTWDVEWLPDAEQELAAIWLQATDRQAVTAAADAIDRRLSRDPEQEGESRSQDVRVTFEKPLGVLFHVSVDERRVKVVHVWQFE